MIWTENHLTTNNLKVIYALLLKFYKEDPFQNPMILSMAENIESILSNKWNQSVIKIVKEVQPRIELQIIHD